MLARRQDDNKDDKGQFMTRIMDYVKVITG